MPQQDFHGACGHIVQELAVVRNQKHRAPERLQIVLKPFDGLDVQVVGGLVQEQHVRLREQDFGQFDAHVPALAEGFCEAVQFIGLESQAKEHFFRLRTRRQAAFQRQPVVQVVHPLDERSISG